MSDELFLVAHKVRGKPAFDVAIKIDIAGEEGWIIPTSGHRAYPYVAIPLEHCLMPHNAGTRRIHISLLGECPPDLEDHYPAPRAPDAPKPSASGLLAALGLGRPKLPTVKRRL